jgi:hypothetical protein
MVVNGEALLLVIFPFDLFLRGFWKNLARTLEEGYEVISKELG